MICLNIFLRKRMLKRLNTVEELDALQLALEQGAQTVRAGGIVDLSGLDEQVDMLCKEMIKTEGPIRLELLPRLEQIIATLDILEANLRQTQAPEVTQANARLMARQAYGQKILEPEEVTPSIVRNN